MSKHEHKHKCECKHEHIKYCAKCYKPYCVNCGQEWELPSAYVPYYPWYEPYKITWGSSAVDVGNADFYTESITVPCQHN